MIYTVYSQPFADSEMWYRQGSFSNSETAHEYAQRLSNFDGYIFYFVKVVASKAEDIW